MLEKKPKYNFLKEVIVRIDHNGVSHEELNKMIYSLNNDHDLSVFKSYQETNIGRVHMQVEALKSIARSFNLNIPNLLQESLHLYCKGQIKDLEDELILYVTKYFSYFVINCKNYHSIKPYLDFIKTYLDVFVSHCRLFNITRVGIAKNDNVKFKSIYALRRVFNGDILKSSINSTALKEIETEEYSYTECLKNNKGHRANFKRNFYQVESSNHKQSYILDLTIDCYIDENYINSQNSFKDNFRNECQELNDFGDQIFNEITKGKETEDE